MDGGDTATRTGMNGRCRPEGDEPPCYDLVGVGIGPFNLSLAALADGVAGLRTLFLEARSAFSWHPGLLLDGTTLQVPFLADLVTLVDPTSPWSFLAYLRAHGRLFPFYFAERFHIARREYDHYCRWVADALPSCRFGARVDAVHWDRASRTFRVGFSDAAGAGRMVSARAVVLGVGTEPVVPPPLAHLMGDRVFHSAVYLERRAALAGAQDVTVIGSGQSGAEVFLDLLQTQGMHGPRLRWLTRSPAFAPMEYSKLGLEHFTPDYTAYFRNLPPDVRGRLVDAQWQLYKGISEQTIAEIHDRLYDRSVDAAIGGSDASPVTLMPNVAVTGAHPRAGGVELACHHREQDRHFTVRTDGVVLATGYAPRRPAFLEPVRDLVDWDEQGRYRVDGQYRIRMDPAVAAGLYVQNAELHTHGVGAPDLGLGAWRSAVILNAVTGRTVHRLPERTAYTTFGLIGEESTVASGDPERTSGGPATTGSASHHSEITHVPSGAR